MLNSEQVFDLVILFGEAARYGLGTVFLTDL